MEKQNKKKYYLPDYILYCKRGYSAAVFIVKDIAKSINTSGMWIDILNASGSTNKYNQWDFSSIKIELFPRKIRPKYPKNATTADKKYITWKTATEDIAKQRTQNYKGDKFIVRPKLININEGKTKIVEKMWNKKFERYVPKEWIKTSDCEMLKIQVPITPKWAYSILSVEKL